MARDLGARPRRTSRAPRRPGLARLRPPSPERKLVDAVDAVEDAAREVVEAAATADKAPLPPKRQQRGRRRLPDSKTTLGCTHRMGAAERLEACERGSVGSMQAGAKGPMSVLMAQGPSSRSAGARERGSPMACGEIMGRQVDLLAPHASRKAV